MEEEWTTSVCTFCSLASIRMFRWVVAERGSPATRTAMSFFFPILTSFFTCSSTSLLRRTDMSFPIIPESFSMSPGQRAV